MILIFLLVAVAGFTQTKTFKAYLLGTILEQVNASVRGSVWVSSLDGNLITGLTLRDVEIATENKELARIDEVRVSYDLVGFLLGSVRLSEVEVLRPSIFLFRSADGTLNLTRFLPEPSEVPDTSAASSTVTVRRLRVEGGRFRMVDSVALAARAVEAQELPRRAVDYADIDLSLLTLDAGLTLLDKETRINIANLSFELPRHDLRLQHLSADVRLQEHATRVEGLEIVTGRSSLLIDALLAKGLGEITSVADLKGTATRLALTARDLDLGELRQFLYPSIEFLDRSVLLDLRVSGTFDRLAVDRLALRTPASFIQMRGYVSNLHRPEDLTLDIQGDESVARSDDIAALLPGLDLPSWERFGDVSFFFTYNGKPLDFHARISASSERGSVDADGRLTIGRFLTYKGTVRTEDFDLGGFVGDGTEVSQLNATMEVDGSGTDIRSLIAVMRMTADSSRIYGVDVRRSVAVIDAAQGTVNGHADAHTGAGSITLTGRSRVDEDGVIRSYAAQGSLRGFDLARLTGQTSYASELNLDISAGGFSDSTVSKDSVRLAFLDSRFGDYTVQSSAVNVRQERANGRRSITLESVPATVRMEGTFEPADLPALATHAIGMIVGHADQVFGDLGHLRPLEEGSRTEGRVAAAAQDGFGTSDVRIMFDIRSLEPVGALGGVRLTGDASGMLDIVGSPGDFQVSGRASSSFVSLDDTAFGAAGKNLKVDFFADRLEEAGAEGHSGTSLTVGIEALRLEETLLSSVSLRTDMQGRSGMLSLDALVDSSIRITSSGTFGRSGEYASFALDQMSVEMNSFTLSARDTVIAVLGADGVMFQRAIFGSKEDSVSLSGIFHPGGISDLRADLLHFRASHIAGLAGNSSFGSTVAGLDGVIDAMLLFRGSLNHPNVQLRVHGGDVRLDRVSFGQLEAQISYFERLLSLDVTLNVRHRDGGGTPDLLLRGSVPFDLTFAGEKPDEPLEGEIDLVMISTGIDMGFFEPFLASVTRDLEGTFTCNIRMTGDVSDPRYEGMATIRNSRFLFVPTRMVYRLDGNFLTADDRIQMQNVLIRNAEADYASGRMNVTGSLFLSGITLNGFDLGFNGELRLMREDSSRALGSLYYGDLTAATGGPGLNWKGTIDRSKFSGQMLIRNAQITLPPDRESQQVSTRLIEIIRDQDSANVRARRSQASKEKAFAVTDTREEEAGESFVDRIDFDLTLETQGATQVRFIFNTQANDVLFADLRGRLSFLRDQASTRLIGDIEVTDRSYYNFLKRFSASGRLLFTGNPLNPELDIVARYQGIHKKIVSGSVASADGPQQTVDERVTVVLSLQGPRSELRTKFDIEVEDPTSTEGVRRLGSEGGNTDVEGDAIAFIMTGQFRDELTEQQRSGLLTENLGYGLASGLLTGPLSETLRRTTRGTIQSLDVIYFGGGQLSQGADVRVSGQLGDAVYRVGGRVFDSIDNTNIIIEIPMSALLNSNELRNLILTLERRVEGTENVEDQRQSSNEARIQYRIRF